MNNLSWMIYLAGVETAIVWTRNVLDTAWLDEVD